MWSKITYSKIQFSSKFLPVDGLSSKTSALFYFSHLLCVSCINVFVFCFLISFLIIKYLLYLVQVDTHKFVYVVQKSSVHMADHSACKWFYTWWFVLSISCISCWWFWIFVEYIKLWNHNNVCLWECLVSPVSTYLPYILAYKLTIFGWILTIKLWRRLIRGQSTHLVFAYPDNGYPDLSVNFTAAKNPDILKWKSGCCGCLQKWCKLCLWYSGGTSNYCKINSHASKEWMVTLVSQNRSKECLLAYFLSMWITYTYVTFGRPIVRCFHFTGCQYRYTYLLIQTSNCAIKSTSELQKWQ